MTIAITVGSSVIQGATFRAEITVCSRIVGVVAFSQVPFDVVRTAVGNSSIDIPVFKPLADAGGEVAGIEPDAYSVEADQRK